MKRGKSGAGGLAATGSDKGCRRRIQPAEKCKKLRSGIMHKSGGLFQVEVRPKGWRANWKLHFGTHGIEAEAHVARDFCTFLRVSNGDFSKAEDYHFPKSVVTFEEFERSQDPQVCDLFRIVCQKCVKDLPNSTHRAGAVSPGKHMCNGSKDPDLKLLNAKAWDRIKEMMGKFKELYPQEFATSTGISKTVMDEADTRVQTLQPFYTDALIELVTNEQWKILGEILKTKGKNYMVSLISDQYHCAKGWVPSLHHELVSDPQVAGTYPPTSNKPFQSLPNTLQDINRAPDSAVGWTNGEPNIAPSLSTGMCFLSSSVQQQFSPEVEQRDHNGHHDLQDWEKELALLPGQQKLYNPAFPNLDEVMNSLLPEANLVPADIPVIDFPVNLLHHPCADDNLFDCHNPCDAPFCSGDHVVTHPVWDYTKTLN